MCNWWKFGLTSRIDFNFFLQLRDGFWFHWVFNIVNQELIFDILAWVVYELNFLVKLRMSLNGFCRWNWNNRCRSRGVLEKLRGCDLAMGGVNDNLRGYHLKTHRKSAYIYKSISWSYKNTQYTEKSAGLWLSTFYMQVFKENLAVKFQK